VGKKGKKVVKLRKGGVGAVLTCYESIKFNHSEVFHSEKRLREFFNLNNNHICVDGGAHYNSCPWVIIEETTQGIDKGIRQLESMASLIESRGSIVKRAFLLVERLASKNFQRDNNWILIYKPTKKPFLIGSKSNSYVFVGYYGNKLETLTRKIIQVEKNLKDR